MTLLPGVASGGISFGEPVYLWLLLAPGVLLILWLTQLLRRRADAKRVSRQRLIPVRERLGLVGDLGFWLCLTLAIALCIMAVARPRARVFVAGRTGGADFVILLDGSASMYVSDVSPDRWRRSIRFVREFAESLSWEQDRVALALFAYFAAPQIRLTRDPNALFFFLENLSERSPFRLEDDPTWNTNIEEGVNWGLRLVETNEELFGKSDNPKAFLIITDGQAWTGRAATALNAARSAGIPVHVVGVGTATGGYIPENASPTAPASLFHSILDRNSLRAIARGGGGDYFEIGREPDRDVAARIIGSVRRRAPLSPLEESFEELYWRFLFAAAIFMALGTLLLRQRTELWWHAAAVLVSVFVLAGVAGLG
jgi:Ca-activated chloride channel family protein